MHEGRGFGRRDRNSSSGGGSGQGFWSPREQEPSTAPVKVGDEMTVNIEAVGVKGDGIAKKEGFVLFVPNAKQGQLVKIRITKVLRKVGFAEIVGGAAAAGAQSESSEAPAEAAPVEEAPAEEPSAEDTEDFGE